MRALVLTAWSRVLRKPGQSVLAAAVLFASTLLLATAVQLLAGMHRPFESMFEQLAGSHINFMMDTRIYNADAVLGWWKDRSTTRSVAAHAAIPIAVDTRIWVDGRETDQMPSLCELPAKNDEQDRLLVLSSLHPGGIRAGEAWIPTSLAQALKLKTGDRISLPTDTGLAELTVGAVVVDPVFASGFMNPKRVWVAPGFLTSHFPATRLTSCFVAVRLSDPAVAESEWSAFAEHMGGGFNGLSYRYESLRQLHGLLLQMMALAFLVFALLGIAGSVFLVQATIRASVLADYRELGVLKALGFTPGQLAASYALQYSGLALGAAMLAVPCSALLGHGFLARMTAEIGITAPATFSLMPFLVPALFVFLLATSVAFLSGREAGRVRPADAIRYGASLEDKGHRRAGTIPILPGIPVWISTGIAAVSRERRRLVYAILTGAFTAFLAAFSLDFLAMLSRANQQPADWGFTTAEVLASRGMKRFTQRAEEFTENLRREPGVVDVLPWGALVDFTTPPKDGMTPGILVGDVFDGVMDGFGFTNIRGRNPTSRGEISLAVNTARQAETDVGGTFDLFMYGRSVRFTVTGVYRSVNNFGQGYRLQAQSLRELDPLFEPPSAYVKLMEGTDVRAWMEKLLSRYGESMKAQPATEIYMRTFGMIASGMTGVLLALIAFFSLVLGLSVYNSSRLEIAANRLPLGVLRTAGMTPLQMRTSIAAGASLVGLLGGLVGVMAALLLSDRVLAPFMDGVVGMTGLRQPHDPVNSGMAVLAVVLVSALFSWLASGQAVRTHPRSLVME